MKPHDQQANCAEAQIFEPEHWRLIDRLSRRRFPKDVVLAEEAASFVFYKLTENRWKRIRSWSGKTGFHGFVVNTISRLLTDFQRHRFGRIRPPKMVQERAQENSRWSEVYDLLVVQGRSRIEILNQLSCEENLTMREELEGIISGIVSLNPTKPRYYEERLSFETLQEAGEWDVDHAVSPASADRRLDQEFHVSGMLESAPVGGGPVNEQSGLTQHERRFLELYFVDGRTLTWIGRELGVKGAPAAHLDLLLRKCVRLFDCQHATDHAYVEVDTPHGENIVPVGKALAASFQLTQATQR